MPVITDTITATTGTVLTVTSADPVLNVTATGAILGAFSFGIEIQSEATRYLADITVDGIVSASGAGLWFRDNGGSVSIGAHGVIRGGSDTGIVAFLNSTEEIHISNAGQVIGFSGISSGAADDSIDNSGTIRGLDTDSIATNAGNDTVTNSGKIIGDVLLGNGDDRFIAKAGGTVDGTVNGGAGDDRYRIVDNTLTLADDSGVDTVLSTVSHKLGADFENLKLKGGRDLNGTGNAENNVITGNEGDNTVKARAGDDTVEGRKGADRLYGGDGDDTLDGGRGRDVLRGGDGNDTFVFSTGTGRDRIADFDALSGDEDVDLSGLDSITGFSDLRKFHMTQVGADVVINAGNASGDVLTLVGVDIGDLDASDFLF